jgi:hypothetical protein
MLSWYYSGIITGLGENLYYIRNLNICFVSLYLELLGGIGLR